MPHGVFFQDVSDALATIVTAGRLPNIGVAAPVPAGASGFAIGDLTVLRTPTEVAALGLPVDSDLQRGLDTLFSMTKPTVVLFGTDPGANQAEAAANIAGSASLNTGVYKFKEAESEVGVRPDTIIAPGFSEATVHTSLIGCAEAISASTLVDGPNTDDATAIALADATSDSEGRANMIDPWGTLGADTIAGSWYGGAVYADTPWWESPSNVALNNITGTTRPIFHELTNEADQAQALNDAKITTIVRRDGFRLWGNRNLSGDGYDLPFIVQRRSDDVVKRALAKSVASRVDDSISPALADLFVRSLQAFFDREQAAGHIAGGLSRLNPDLNTPQSLGAGNIYIDYEITFNVPAENITFRSIFTNRFLENVTG